MPIQTGFIGWVTPYGKAAGLLLIALAASAQNYTIPNQNVTSGPLPPFEHPGTITASNLTVSGSGSVTVVAGTQVTLLPGFDAKAGSAPITFDAKIASSEVVISGTITLNGAALPGVTVALSIDNGEMTTTNANGQYAITVPAGGSYGVTPSIAGNSFSPPVAAFWNLKTNGIANFTAATGTSSPFTLNPTPPSKEYIRVNGQPAVVENWH